MWDIIRFWLQMGVDPFPLCERTPLVRQHDELTRERVASMEGEYMRDECAGDKARGLNLGIRRAVVPLLENDRRRMDRINGKLMALPGPPTISYGDEIGMG